MSRRFNRDDIDKFHDYSLYIPHRTIYMGSESHDVSEGESGTDGAMAERMIKNLAILDAMSGEPITIIMNNPGGDPYHGLAIFDAIRACRSEVIVKVLGAAMSMGSIILQAADQRLMAPNARVMIHVGYFGMNEHAKTVYKWVEENKKIDEWMEELFLAKIREKHPMFPARKVKQMCEFDTILDARETVHLGLADGIIGEEVSG